jgi:hypothetical protein
MVEAARPLASRVARYSSMWPRSAVEHDQPGVGGPLEVGPQVEPIGLEGPAAVAGQERRRGELGAPGGVVGRHERRRWHMQCGHGSSSG